VVFRVYAPEAVSVEVMGDFNGWQNGETLLPDEHKPGWWQVRLIVPSSLNRIEYFYWLDGSRPKIDPSQPVVADDFAGENNLLVLP